MNESSLSVKQLVERYGTSKPTIHEKLKHPDIQPYVKKENNCLFLDIDGLNVLNTLMAHSKVASRKVNEQKDDSLQKVNDLSVDIFNNPYVESLKKQIESLEKDKESLKEILQSVTDGFRDFQKYLSAPNEKESTKEVKQENKGILAWLRGMK